MRMRMRVVAALTGVGMAFGLGASARAQEVTVCADAYLVVMGTEVLNQSGCQTLPPAAP